MCLKRNNSSDPTGMKRENVTLYPGKRSRHVHIEVLLAHVEGPTQREITDRTRSGRGHMEKNMTAGTFGRFNSKLELNERAGYS